MEKSMFSFVRPGIILAALCLSATTIFLGCEPEGVDEPFNGMEADMDLVNMSKSAGKTLPHKELAELRAAVAHLRDLESAKAAGYDIQLTGNVPQMGFHYLNASLLDDTFEVTKPELLIFAPAPNGDLRFVGVEYAQPISDLSDPQDPPEGFSGNADEWSVNTEFSVWTLHAWVGLNNPNGIFAMHNSRIP